MEDNKDTNKIFYILLFFAIVLTCAIFKTLSSVILPVIFALILAFTLLPLIQFLNIKLKFPWILGTFSIIFLLIIVIFGISSLLVSSLSSIFSEYPKYETKFLYIYQLIAQQFNLEFDAGQSFIENVWKYLQVRQYIQKGAIFLSTGLVSFSKSVLLILLLLTFLLLEIRFTKKKISRNLNESSKSTVLSIIQTVINETQKYLSIKFFVSLATGFLVTIVSIIFGLDFPIVWGFLAFLMNFIPTFGSIISVLITTLFGLLQFYPESILKVILLFILLVAINFTIGNIIEPKIEGEQLGLSPFVILVSLSLWGWIWGFVGMILAVPMTVICKIVCENISYLKIIAVILGNSSDKSNK